MSPTPDPGYPAYQKLWGRCGCGVPRSAAQAFHELSNCACRHHDPQLCATCTEKANQAAFRVEAEGRLAELLPEIERRLAAEVQYGPFIVY